ncbi:hypothetical protein [Pantoea sp.]|uniref:hypothetical protein n=1 Tax=Pantoea sp. TaxID=69393 RepID=UPI0031DA707B
MSKADAGYMHATVAQTAIFTFTHQWDVILHPVAGVGITLAMACQCTIVIVVGILFIYANRQPTFWLYNVIGVADNDVLFARHPAYSVGEICLGVAVTGDYWSVGD